MINTNKFLSDTKQNAPHKTQQDSKISVTCQFAGKHTRDWE